ncbi:MAG: UDP-N-acetylmuramate--alanine ligase [Urechidicola sp.]|jgi:UDP-N-acetylmuramate--alanine ligase|tara:strand:+ start:108 stop:1454 length:1347 start_codon:yes stop_codon:yes gene_type:complete
MNLDKIHTIYFVGIGGIGMSALARYFAVNGKKVAGFDMVQTDITNSLSQLGVDIHYQDSIDLIPSNFKDSQKTLVVYTPAIPKENLELHYFNQHNFKVLKRSEVLGEITKNSFCLAVAGTHGKTTTSTILGHILKEAQVNATSFLGGISENYNSNLILGGDKISVVEADEFDRSFLKLSPNIACITSMDADHLDIYGKADALEYSFNEFADKVSDKLIVRKGLPLKGLTYSVDEKADYYADNIKIINGVYVFDVKTPTEIITNVEFNLPGKHNVLNAVAALAMANNFGVSLQVIAKALLSFKGVQRRFSYKIKTNNLVLIDDYAHHPTEIIAVADSIKEMYPNQKTLAVFQPHLFSRTKDFADNFAQSLNLFDEIILLDIYPAREKPIKGITSQWLLDKISNTNKKLSSKEDLLREMKNSKATVKVMIGAGDIGQLVAEIQKGLLDEN